MADNGNTAPGGKEAKSPERYRPADRSADERSEQILDEKIIEDLRKAFDPILDEPVPERLLEVLRQPRKTKQ